jgi:hypothetical protein
MSILSSLHQRRTPALRISRRVGKRGRRGGMMSKAMTIFEFNQLVAHITEKHPPYMSKFTRENKGLVGKGIKYIYPSFDMRDIKVFAVSFNGFSFGDKTFHTQNDCRDLPESLFDRIMAWLDSEED